MLQSFVYLAISLSKSYVSAHQRPQYLHFFYTNTMAEITHSHLVGPSANHFAQNKTFFSLNNENSLKICCMFAWFIKRFLRQNKNSSTRLSYLTCILYKELIW